MKTGKLRSLNKYFGIFIPLFIIVGTTLIYFISKGYKINISNGEIEKTGILTFTTIPRKATVYIDNEYVGRSPKAVSGLNGETHSIKITKDGYLDWLMDIHVKTEQSIPVKSVLFLKEPTTEILFPETDTNDLFVDQLFFDQDGQMAVFTTITDTDESGSDLKTLQIWAYTINKKFWEFEPRPRKIAEFTEFSETTESPLSLRHYNILVSKNAQKILFSTGSENSQRHFILQTNIENQNPLELEDLAGYNDLSPTWSNDSQHLIFSITGQLRSININSKVQTILDEKGKDEFFIWTSDKNGLVYTVDETDQIYTISRIHSNGENKTDIIENIKKSSSRSLFGESETNEPETEEAEVTAGDDQADSDKPATLTEKITYIDTINEIQITDDSKNLMLLTDTQVLLYTLDNNEIQRILIKSPRYIAATEDNHKFIFLSGSDQLIEYTSQVEDGDPVHKVGSKILLPLAQELSYTKFRWYPEYSNVIYSTKVTSEPAAERIDDTVNSETETGETATSGNATNGTEPGGTKEAAQYKLYVINTDSLQIFNIFDNGNSPVFAVGNSGKYVVTLCDGMKLCKVTIHE